MDIGAYARIEDLSAILASTGINIPRLRGLRLMATEEKISEDEIKEMADSAEVDALRTLSGPARRGQLVPAAIHIVTGQTKI